MRFRQITSLLLRACSDTIHWKKCVWRPEGQGNCHLSLVLGRPTWPQTAKGPHSWPVTGDMMPQVAFHTKKHSHTDGTCVTVSQRLLCYEHGHPCCPTQSRKMIVFTSVKCWLWFLYSFLSSCISAIEAQNVMCRWHTSKHIYRMLLTVQDMTGGGGMLTGMLRALRASWQQKPEACGLWVLKCKLGQFFSVALLRSWLSLSARDVVLIVPVKPDHVQQIRTRKQSSITSTNGMLDIAMPWFWLPFPLFPTHDYKSSERSPFVIVHPFFIMRLFITT